MAGIAGAGFDCEARAAREQAVGELLHQPPGAEARQELGLAPASPPPSRWSVRTIRASVAALAPYSRSGVWRLLQRLHLQRRPLRDHLYSPDPDDVAKVAHLERCLREAVRWPQAVVLLFVDELGSYRWPAVAPSGDWPCRQRPPARCTKRDRPTASSASSTSSTPAPARWTTWITPCSAASRSAPSTVVWIRSTPRRDGSMSCKTPARSTTTPTSAPRCRQLPRLEPVWLPTYAPWLHPLEQLWHWLRRDVLRGHRLADDWSQLRHQLNAFLDQFAHGSSALLRSVGLVGAGHLAYVLRRAC
jgi:hypothetical protein